MASLTEMQSQEAKELMIAFWPACAEVRTITLNYLPLPVVDCLYSYGYSYGANSASACAERLQNVFVARVVAVTH